MYSDNYNENKLFPFNPGSVVALGVGTIAAFGAARILSRQQSVIKGVADKSLGGFKWYQKMQAKSATPISKLRMFGRHTWEATGGYWTSYSPRMRFNNAYDRNIHKLWGRDLRHTKNPFEWDKELSKMQNIKAYGKYFKANRLVGKLPAALPIALATLGWELDAAGDASGLFTGLAKEGAAAAGGFAGSILGTAGFGLAGGSSAMATIGRFGGMGVGAMVGYAAVNAVVNMSKLGRKWSMPDLGGNYVDSQESMTMRQRSLNAISTSRFNLRSQLGNEAAHLILGN